MSKRLHPVIAAILITIVPVACLLAQADSNEPKSAPAKKFIRFSVDEIIDNFSKSSAKHVLYESNNEIRVYRYYPHDFLIEHISSTGKSTHYFLPDPTANPKIIEDIVSEQYNRIKMYKGNRYEFIGSRPRPLMDK